MGHSHPAQSAAAAEEGGGPGGVSGPQKICAGLAIDSHPAPLFDHRHRRHCPHRLAVTRFVCNVSNSRTPERMHACSHQSLAIGRRAVARPRMCVRVALVSAAALYTQAGTKARL